MLCGQLYREAIEVYLVRYTNGEAAFSEVFALLWEPRAQFWFLYALFFSLSFLSHLILDYSCKYQKCSYFDGCICNSLFHIPIL